MEETRTLSKSEFMERWKADQQRKEREKLRIHKYLTFRHNRDRLHNLIKKRRTR